MPGRDVRLFLDSNVILSGLLSSKGSPRILLDLLTLQVPNLTGITGEYNLDEIERNLKTCFPALLSLYQEYLPRLHLEVIEVPSYEKIRPLLAKMSPNDAPVLASAQIGRAEYLVTGDKKGFPKNAVGAIAVVTPTKFIKEILPELIRSFV